MATSSTVLRLAGKIVTGTMQPGLFMLTNHKDVTCDEWAAVNEYVVGDWLVEDYSSIGFMYACFTLLLEGDDNF